jgi:hypothetical protein
MTRLPTLRLLNISLELQSIPLVHAERMSHFDCKNPFDNNYNFKRLVKKPSSLYQV